MPRSMALTFAKDPAQNLPNRAGNLLLEVKGLCFGYVRAKVPIVEDLSFALSPGEIFALVGESGCGKSLTGLAIMGLLPPGLGVFSGEIIFRGRDLRRLSAQERRKLRGREVAMIFQDPMTALNPVFTIGEQIKEVLVLHRGFSEAKALAEAEVLLRQVGIPAARERLRSYPHELSGGMRQRVMIAMALAGEPALLIADEPTTALDVTIQAQILDLLREIRDQRGLTVLLISHDLGVVAETAERAAVMYAGRLVEQAPVPVLFGEPRHPYTKALLAALPRPGVKRLSALPGRVPPPGARPSGCKFNERCPKARKRCRQEEPRGVEIAPGHWVRCFYP